MNLRHWRIRALAALLPFFSAARAAVDPIGPAAGVPATGHTSVFARDASADGKPAGANGGWRAATGATADLPSPLSKPVAMPDDPTMRMDPNDGVRPANDVKLPRDKGIKAPTDKGMKAPDAWGVAVDKKPKMPVPKRRLPTPDMDVSDHHVDKKALR